MSVESLAGQLTEEELIYVPGLLSRWVRLANGAVVHYMTAGETGPAVILMHGGFVGSSGSAGWRMMAPFLGANGFRVYCPDRPGYGWADTSEQYRPTYGQKSHVEFLNDFATAVCLEKFHLAGNSAGCTVTAHYVVNHPDHVLSYILVAGGLGDLIEPSQRIASRDSRYSADKSYKTPGWDGSEAGMFALMEGIILRKESITPDLVHMRNQAALRQRAARSGLGALQQHLAQDPNYLQWSTLKGRLDRLPIPALCLYGRDDVLSPVEVGMAQEDALPNIQFFYPRNCGHQGQNDQPEMFNQVFLEFFRDGKVSWKTAQWAGVSRRRPVLKDYVEWPGSRFHRRRKAARPATQQA